MVGKNDLRDWIYAESTLLSSLDAELAQDHGVAQVARGLNSDRLIAVIGSGLSRAYGQPAWWDLAQDTVYHVMEVLWSLVNPVEIQPSDADLGKKLDAVFAENKKKAEAKADPEPWYDPLSPYWKALVHMRLTGATIDVDTKRLPFVFEVCENMLAAIQIFRRMQDGLAFGRRETERQAHAEMRERLKWMLQDRRGRLATTLRKLVGRLPNGHKKTRTMAIYDRIRFDPNDQSAERREFSTALAYLLYSLKSIGKQEALPNFLFPHIEKARVNSPLTLAFSYFFKRIDGSTIDGQSDDDPDTAYLVEAMVALEPQEAAAWLDEASRALDSSIGNTAGGLRKACLAHARQERVNLSTRQDPYAVLVDELEIRRFLTTNYDDELDRLLEARGFVEEVRDDMMSAAQEDLVGHAKPPMTRSMYMDPMQQRAEVLDCAPGSAAYMFEYGADRRDNRVQALHIHGRARKPESQLVLSERDYRERYARDEDPVARSDDAMRQIFTGNPLLFVGLGMEESDILRPLREYSGDVARLTERPAVALMPNDRPGDEKGNDIQTVMANLSTYGVYTILYGNIRTKHCEDFNLLPFLSGINKAIKERLADLSQAKPLIQLNELIHSLNLAGGLTGGVWPRQPSELVAGIFAVEGQAGFSATIAKVLAVAQCMAEAASHGTPHDGCNKAALSIMGDALMSMAKTTLLCARLRQLVANQQEWKENWAKSPQQREPLGKCKVEILEATENSSDQNIPEDPNETASHVRATRHRTLMRALDGPETRSQSHEWVREPAKPPHDKGPWIKFDKTPGPDRDRFFAGAPSPVFPMMRAALAGLDATSGRRVIFMLGGRGVGRGQVFTAMRDERRFAQLCHWLKRISTLTEPSSVKACRIDTRRIHSAFFNLGMSHEVTSVFDRLTYLLEEAIKLRLGDTDSKPFATIAKHLKNHRIKRLRHALQAYTDHSTRMKPAVIVLDHFSVLFNRNGRAKNTQAQMIFDALTDEIYAEAPIDFIFMMNEDFVPIEARRDPVNVARPIVSRWLCPAAMPAAKKDSQRSELTRAGIAFVENQTQPSSSGYDISGKLGLMSLTLTASATPATRPRTSGFYIHLLEPIGPVILGTRFFPRAAAALAVIGKNGGKPSVVGFTNTHNGNLQSEYDVSHYVPLKIGRGDNQYCPLKFQEMLNEVYENWADPSFAIKEEKLNPSAVFDCYVKDEVNAALLSTLADISPPVSADLDFGSERPGGQWLKEKIEQAFTARHSPPNEQVQGIAEQFARIDRICGHNRYAMTVVFAALDDMIARRLCDNPQDLVNLQPIHRLLNQIGLAVSGQEPAVRSDIVIDQVLGMYQVDALNSLGKALPAWPGVFEWNESDGLESLFRPYRQSSGYVPELEWIKWPAQRSCTPAFKFYHTPHNLLYAVQEDILVALSLIGQPVEVSVLLGIGTVHAALGKIVAHALGDSCGDKDMHAAMMRLLILRIMDLLTYRCLVFRIAPKGDEKKKQGRQHHRFATHKTVRRHVYHQFNAPIVDFADIDQLTMSLYATQPNDVPKPSAVGHRRIRTLVEQLSGYERSFLATPLAQPDPAAIDPENARNLQSMRMRAAYGALRSVFSLSTVSRFDAYEDQGMSPPEPGYFEAHRLRVRWLLRKALGLDQLESTDSFLPPFHAEEIVWLFNECGVLSLASGRVDDAENLLKQARLAAKENIEGDGHGPLHNRINLNLALVMIERGCTKDADKILKRIALDPIENDPIHWIAEGYRGLTRALLGDALGAIERLRHNAERLSQISRYRSAAIFRMHLAESLGFSEKKHDEALREADRARELAANGGHEDIRQLAMLTSVQIKIDQLGEAISTPTRRALVNTLDVAEDYARRMGMPRLQGRVQVARARLHLNSGEYQRAAECAQRALKYATRHGIEILKVSALSLLGQAMLLQQRPGARRLLLRARDIAQNSDYNIVVSNIEAMLVPNVIL